MCLQSAGMATILARMRNDDETLGGRAEPFASSDEFFAWLRDHLCEEGHLTEVEEETCELLLLGRNELEIATARQTSVETAGWHVKRILRKLDIESARELLRVVGRRIDRVDGG